MKIEIDKKLLKSLFIMASVVEARDAYTGGHLWRVSQYAKLLGNQLSLPQEDIFLASIGGFMHDLGKVGVPDSILKKPGPLTDQEYNIIKNHPNIGGQLFQEHPLSKLALDVITHHHEWFNGNGYPEGLIQDEISLFSQIIGVVDAFDAMTSTRPYRRGMPVEKAQSILESEKDRQFSGKLVSAFLEIPMDKINHIVGHSEEGIPLLTCPGCGPIITVNNDKKDGDEVVCKSCGGVFGIHKKGDTFDLDVKSAKCGLTNIITPEAELSPIEAFIGNIPSSIHVPI